MQGDYKGIFQRFKKEIKVINMVKKLLAIIMAGVIMTTSTVLAKSQFTDIWGHWAESYITKLVNEGVVDGVTDTKFVPNGQVTRVQYLKMIMEATGLETVTPRSSECLDAGVGEWYAPYLQSALDNGLIPSAMITGYKESVQYTVDDNGHAIESKVVYEGAFNGNTPITREEMAVLTQYIYQFTRTILTNDKKDIVKVKGFADGSEISDWAIISVNHAVANGFMDGMDNNMFNPKDTATRAQAATVISRVLEKVGE